MALRLTWFAASLDAMPPTPDNFFLDSDAGRRLPVESLLRRAMFKLKQPSLALHSHDVPSHRYTMWKSWNMPEGAKPEHVIHWIKTARDHTPELWLRNVVINCHGLDGRLYIGGAKYPVIDNYNAKIFGQLKGMEIGTIWLVACKVASSAIGKHLCMTIAQQVGCSVVAADESQYGVIWCPFGYVDNYEGHTFEWNAAGEQQQVRQDGAGIPGVEA